jgi:lipid-A-disaccharide synthase
MRLFISAGEPSGDLHGGNLVRSLRRLHPDITCAGLGGDQMAEAGCDLLYPLAQHPFIGAIKVLGSVPFFIRLLYQADHYFRTQRPDAVVLIDNPGFNWWLARVARDRRIPVYYFVAPQIWGWAQWRVRKMRNLVDHVLCTLPFEEPWYQKRKVPVSYIGHPYFDELPRQRLDRSFLEAQRERPGTIVGILPGSRGQELECCVPSLIRAAQIIHQRRPHVRFLVACFKSAHEREVKAQVRGMPLPIEVHSGRTPEIIELAHSCLAVSGSVGLELLYRQRPSVVMYRQTPFNLFLAFLLKKSKYISIVNLLAGRELYPEFLSHECRAVPMAEQVLRWLDDRQAYESLRGELKTLCDRVAVPGACDRAAEFLLDRLGHVRTSIRQAA